MWGLAPVATRALVMHLAPLPLLAVRLGAASIILLPWCGPVLRRRPGRAALARLVAGGLLGMVGYNLPVTVGLQWVPASTAGLLLASEPVWILLLGRLFLAERVPGRSWAGAAVALGGVAILAGPGALSLRSGTRELAGAALVLLGTLLFGGYTLVIRPLSRAYGTLPATAASTVAGSLPYAAFAGLVSPRQLGALPAAAWGSWPSSPSAAPPPACCSGTWPCPACQAAGSACCSTWNRWSASSARCPCCTSTSPAP